MILNRYPYTSGHLMIVPFDHLASLELLAWALGASPFLADQLVRHGYPPAVIYKRDRTRYLNALRRADRGDAGPLAEIFARAVTDGVYRFLLPGLAGPHRLVPLRSLTDSELSGNALAVAAKRGRLRAVRRTDQWYSTRQWVQEYKERRYQRA